jgi:hypothetical protein
LSREELIDIAGAVDFIDQEAWDERYAPLLPIIQRNENSRTTTITED